MKYPIILLYALLFLFSQCGMPTDQMSSTETTNGSITGKLVDIYANPEAGAQVRLYSVWHIPTGVESLKTSTLLTIADDTIVLTDSKGEYTFKWPGVGTYNVVGRSDDGRSVLIPSIDVLDTSGVLHEYNIGTDTVRVSGELKGDLHMDNTSDNTEAVVYLRGTGFYTDIGSNGVFSVTDVPQGAYTLVVQSLFAGFLQKEIAVSVKTGGTTNLDIIVVEKDTANKAPVVTGLRDTVISINDTISFSVSATDSNGIVNRFYWNFENGGVFRFDTTEDGTCAHVFPSKPAISTVTVSVVDSTGIAGSQSINVSVIRDPPLADAGRDTTVTAGTLYTLLGSGTDLFGKIMKYRFDTDADGIFDDSSSISGVKQFNAPEIPGTHVIIIQVEDDDGNTANSMMLLDVVSKGL